jgi:hypothetical protein
MCRSIHQTFKYDVSQYFRSVVTRHSSVPSSAKVPVETEFTASCPAALSRSSAGFPPFTQSLVSGDYNKKLTHTPDHALPLTRRLNLVVRILGPLQIPRLDHVCRNEPVVEDKLPL